MPINVGRGDVALGPYKVNSRYFCIKPRAYRLNINEKGIKKKTLSQAIKRKEVCHLGRGAGKREDWKKKDSLKNHISKHEITMCGKEIQAEELREKLVQDEFNFFVRYKCKNI